MSLSLKRPTRQRVLACVDRYIKELLQLYDGYDMGKTDAVREVRRRLSRLRYGEVLPAWNRQYLSAYGVR